MSKSLDELIAKIESVPEVTKVSTSRSTDGRRICFHIDMGRYIGYGLPSVASAREWLKREKELNNA